MQNALSSLQSPQDDASASDRALKNAALINQFNHANAHERMTRNQSKMTPPNYDALIQKMHGIDAKLMSGKMTDKSRFDPSIIKLAQTAQMIGKPDLAYNILNEANRRIVSRDEIGGAPLSSMAWEKLRDYAGQKAVNQHGAEESSDTGPVSFPGGEMRQQQQMLQKVSASPTSKDDLYRIGVESFDRQFAKHKHYLVHDDLPPNFGMAPPQKDLSPQNPPPAAAPVVPPGLESIVHNAGVIGQQQQQGAPVASPTQFEQAMGGVES